MFNREKIKAGVNKSMGIPEEDKKQLNKEDIKTTTVAIEEADLVKQKPKRRKFTKNKSAKKENQYTRCKLNSKVLNEFKKYLLTLEIEQGKAIGLSEGIHKAIVHFSCLDKDKTQSKYISKVDSLDCTVNMYTEDLVLLKMIKMDFMDYTIGSILSSALDYYVKMKVKN